MTHAGHRRTRASCSKQRATIPDRGLVARSVATQSNRSLDSLASVHGGRRRVLGYIGALLLLLLIPVKLLRFGSAAGQVWLDLAPSLLGPLGLFFFLTSAGGKLARLTVPQMAILVGVVAVGLELVQLVPRPGILARVRYTFDVLDLVASVLSVALGALVVGAMIHRGRSKHRPGPGNSGT